MKFSFQTATLFVLITMIHLLVIAGFSRLSSEPQQFLADLDGAELMEEFFGDSPREAPEPVPIQIENPVAEYDVVEETESAADADFLSSSPDQPSGPPDLREDPVGENRTDERGEVSAIVDARLLSGRIESPDPDMNSEAIPQVYPPAQEEQEKERAPAPVETSVPATPVRAAPVPESNPETPAVTVPAAPVAPAGPHKLRSIRPISG